ncbi:MAG: AAA family ATPase [Patescibacteria group bacterium]|nr:AAA family ATPase [Patescibacteria group bacterium]MDE1944904.1 AAA family ATPase [Patescibacteria group bacterium]
MLKRLEVVGFKSFARKTVLDFSTSVTAIVGPNGSGKSNIAEAFRFALGEQSMKSMRGKRAEDLIWGGSHTTPRASRAGVAIVFDNAAKSGKRPFDIDFDEVVIERVVTRDGASEYSINGSKVRLRDVQELLAGGNIGETEHHIISQGEADRILLASARERRALVEDALGLRAYEFKKREAEGKLEKTEENTREVNALRRELAPHLKFLARQIEKLERAEELRRELIARAKEYFALEDAYLETAREAAKAETAEREGRLAALSAELAAIEENAAAGGAGGKQLEALRAAERELATLRGEKAELARELGRTEGAIAAAKERNARAAREPYAKVPREELTALAEEIERAAGERDAEASAEALRAVIAGIRTAVRAFVSRFIAPSDLMPEEERELHALGEKQGGLAERDAQLSDSIERAESRLARAREALTAETESSREERRRILDLASEKAKEEGALARAEARAREIVLLAEELDRAKAEAVAIAGREAVSYERVAAAEAERRGQEERKRALERLVIRLEEAGGTGEDIRHEYREAAEREAFLARELEDLERSAAALRDLIRELDAELSGRFTDGLAKVNDSFDEFFKLLFGGGSARLALEEFDVEAEGEDPEERSDEGAGKLAKQGIEIAIALPKKKVRGLLQLSGGERALTSIALVFAMSQVNPPPFLILDETDAALDEANSRRYGDMIEALAKHSQLIVITHNRETMSRAGILYGVTMGADGVSKLLSVKFEDAVAVAK